MISSRIIQCCRVSPLTCTVRSVTRPTPRLAQCLSSSSTTHNEAIPLPSPAGPDKVYAPHIEALVMQISQLTLLEVADLTAALKLRLAIPDAAPVAMVASAAATPADRDEEELSGVKEIKSSFAVRLTGFDASKKVAVIKYVKSCMEGFNLVQAKKFVEDLPAMVRADIGKDEADKLKEELEAAGATAEID